VRIAVTCVQRMNDQSGKNALHSQTYHLRQDADAPVMTKVMTKDMAKVMATDMTTDSPVEGRDELKLRVMRVLEGNPTASQRQIAAELGVSLGGINFCLKALAEKGLIKMGNFARAERKLGYAYILTPAGVNEKAHLTARFLKRKLNEYEALREEIALLQREISNNSEA
jgi:MarR family transcriptional regulator, temperature-dependent positive regulator of motility